MFCDKHGGILWNIKENMSNYRPIDSKREEFRKYLERAGVMDALTKVLVSLYEEAEKPDDALEYVCKHLAGHGLDSEDIGAMRIELETIKAKVEELELENTALKEKLLQYEGPGDGNEESQANNNVAPVAEGEGELAAAPDPAE